MRKIRGREMGRQTERGTKSNLKNCEKQQASMRIN
jgi:hypothetical protein